MGKMTRALAALVSAFIIAAGHCSAPVHASPAPALPVSGEADTNQCRLVSSADLLEKARELDKRSVVFQGEIVGDLMRRRDHMWINVSDGVNAIGVWLAAGQADDLKIAGRYSTRGDVVQVSGTFNRACTEHGGDYDIHAQSLVKIEAGYPVPHPVNPWLVMASMAASSGAMLVIFILLRQWLRKSSRRHYQNREDRYA